MFRQMGNETVASRAQNPGNLVARDQTSFLGIGSFPVPICGVLLAIYFGGAVGRAL